MWYCVDNIEKKSPMHRGRIRLEHKNAAFRGENTAQLNFLSMLQAFNGTAPREAQNPLSLAQRHQ